MNVAFSKKLALVLVSTILAYSNRIDIDDYCRGKYNMDTVFERFEDVKAAVNDPANATVYPYSDPEVQEYMKNGMAMKVIDIGIMKEAARALGNENMKLSKLLLHKNADLNSIIFHLTLTKISANIYPKLGTNPAMNEFMMISEEGLSKKIEWLQDLRQRKDAGASWGYE